MENTTPTKSDVLVNPKNEALFELYSVWRGLPIPILKQMSETQITDQMGFDDDQVLELVYIKSQKEFALKYGLHPDTLTDWNKKIRKNDPLYDSKGWARTLTKNVMMSFYNHTIRKGNPLLYKLFFQVVNDWEESSKVKFAPGNINILVDLMAKKVEAPTTPTTVLAIDAPVDNKKKAKKDVPKSTGSGN